MSSQLANDPTPLDRALEAFSAVVGVANIHASAAELERTQRCTLPVSKRAGAVVLPGSTEEVAEVVRIATRFGIAIYPISRGKNWGYGSRTPTTNAAVVVDLSRMNAIGHYDRTLGTVEIEPGVTQQQLVDFLKDEGAEHWADTTSVTPLSSVLGNALERGHGLTPYADHVECISHLQVVLPNADVIDTGHGRFGSNQVVGLERWSAGPEVTGLFSQGNLGVVTKATLLLMPTPQAVRAVVIDVDSDEAFMALIPRLNELRLRGTIQSGPRMANMYRSLMFQPYPWDLVEPGGTLSKVDALELAKKRGGGAWRICFASYGSTHEVDARIQTMHDALDGLLERDPLIFDPLDPSPPPNSEGRNTKVLGCLLTGDVIEGGAATPRTYWKKRVRPTSGFDPDRDRCGVIWLAPVTPFRAEDIGQVQRLVEEIFPRHGFEPDISMYGLRPRALHFHISIIFDRDVPGADASARAAHDELLTQLLDAGYPPHRLGTHSMWAMERMAPKHRQTLRTLKKALDPAGILAPGRYLPLDTVKEPS